MLGRRDYRNSVQSYWSQLSHRIEKLNDVVTDSEEFTSRKDEIIGNVDYFGKLVEKVFNYQERVTWNGNMRNLLNSAFTAITTINAGEDAAPITTATAGNIVPAITSQLQRLGWPPEATTPLFLNMWTGWLNEATAKKANKPIDFDTARKLAYDNAMAFANAYSSSVISRFPELFT